MRILNIKFFLVVLSMIVIQSTSLANVPVKHHKLDSLNNLLNSKLSKYNRLDVLHHACSILYKEDINQEQLYKHAKEGIEIAKELEAIEMGSDLAVWILRANIYLRSYHRNPPYYKYLKDLYKKGQIEKQKYIQPLYSEIYSYIDYGKLSDAEVKMIELAELVDRDNPKQWTYYLDIYISFKRKANEHKAASEGLAEFVEVTQKIDDPRFSIIANSRSAEFYLEDSLNYQKSYEYAQKALDIVHEENVPQLKQSILLQVSKALYQLEDKQHFSSTFKQISIDSFSSNDNILRKDYYTFAGDLAYDEKEYGQAVKNYKQAVQFLENSDFSSMEKLTFKIQKCHVREKDYKEAFKYSNRLNVLKDSLSNQENIKAISFFESKLKIKDAETERIKLESKITTQRKNFLFMGFLVSLAIIGLILYNRLLDTQVRTRTKDLDCKNKELQSSIEELAQFNYIASHDIKEPMRVVASMTGLIEKKLQKENNNKYAAEFKMVDNSISQLYTLIEDLSQFLEFKSKKVTYQSVDSNALAESVTQMLSNFTKKKNGTVEFENLPEIYSSSSLLTIIFKNLIENGIKYNDSTIPKVAISYSKQDGKHVFDFKDNGIGIDQKYHDYVFKMFKRLENSKIEGSGLGLGLVSKAAEKLNGSITVSKSHCQGSIFTLTLPETYN